MPFLMSFALEHEIVTFAWIDNASVQFPLNIYATKGCTLSIRTRRQAPGGSHSFHSLREQHFAIDFYFLDGTVKVWRGCVKFVLNSSSHS